MALPILETARYELTLPSIDKKVSYRPFLVKEEKILLMALESGETKQITKALQDIVLACTFGELNVENLPTFDVEYIFLQIRAKSVGEIAKVKIKCPDDDKTFVPVEVDLSKINVQVDDEHTNQIKINDNVKIIMKYPTLDSFSAGLNVQELKTEDVFDVMCDTIYEIYEGEKVHKATDYTKDEMMKFLESMSGEAFKKMQEFFRTMPKLIHEVEVVNPNTKVKSKVKLQGLQSFFQ
tara:strand:- start:573 stop:1283 length:711 start_codon:yes stop_codon:yes gene_type:complete